MWPPHASEAIEGRACRRGACEGKALREAAEEVGAGVIAAAELDAFVPFLIERGVDFARLMCELRAS
jgi:hypothetical protein